MTERRRSLFEEFSLDAPHVTETRRLLQTLAREDREGRHRAYMVTSATRGEGKSTVCALTAIVAAKIFRRKVLLIDTDFRRPAIHHLLGCSQRRGLFDLLNGRATLDEVTFATPVPTLSAIVTGRVSGSMSEAYRDEAFGDLMRDLRSQYDLILLDSAPVVPVIEPLMIAEHVDAVILVAMAGKTPVTMIRRMRQVIVPVEHKVVGAILNNAINGLPYYYDYRYYGYERPKPHRFRSRKETPADPGGPPRKDPGQPGNDRAARQRGGA